MKKILGALWSDERGATAMEYGLIAGLVSVAAIFALTQMGGALTSIFNVVSSQLVSASAAAAASGGTSP